MKKTSLINRQIETFPSKVHPEISPEDQDLKIDPLDAPKDFRISFTLDEIIFLKKLLSEQSNSPVWITEVNRIRLTLLSIAHQVKTSIKTPWGRKKSILDPEFDINTLLPEDLKEADPETEPKKRNYVLNKYTPGSPFV